MKEFEPRAEADVTRTELALVWRQFMEYGSANPQIEADIRGMVREVKGAAHYSPGETEVAVEAMRVADFGFMLAMKEGGLQGQKYTELLTELTTDDLIMKTIMNIDNRGTEKHPAWIKLSPRPVISGEIVRLTIAGVEYDRRRIAGRTVSAHLDDQMIIDLIFGAAEEYAHYCYYQAKSAGQIARALSDYMIYDRQSTIFGSFRRLDLALVAYHSSILERRAMIWKAAIAKRYFPSLLPYIMVHIDDIYDKRYWQSLDESANLS